MRYTTRQIDGHRFESAAFLDLTGNGVFDLVCGAWWYEGPDYTVKHRLWDPPAQGDYFDDFSSIGWDPHGRGYADIITGGFFGQQLIQLHNPGNALDPWRVEVIAEPGHIETTRAWDIDGDGLIEMVPNCPGRPLTIFDWQDDRWVERVVSSHIQGHGIGCGDIAGHGRKDIVLADGWLEAPENPWQEPWRWHQDFNLGRASVPIIVTDLTGNGLGDLIVGEAHDYGLYWLEQKRPNQWVQHQIEESRSQYHELLWRDVDGDGECELITGKRYWAHCGKDPGAKDALGVYQFRWDGSQFVEEHIADCGLGIFADAADLNSSGKMTIAAPGKDGLHLITPD